MKHTMPFAILFLVLFLQSCTLGPRYTPPYSEVPDEWKNVTQENAQPCYDFWWEVFEDDTLNELAQLAVLHNYDLYSSLQRIAEARALAGVEFSNLLPQVTLNPSYYNTGILFKLYGLNAIPIPLNNINPIVRVHEMEYTFPFNLNYELDLWGKIRGEWKSAVYNAQSKEEAFRALLLSLTADLASYYFNLRAADADIHIILDTIANRQKSLDLVKKRNSAGLANDLDVSRAELELSNVQAEYEDAVRQRLLFENAIATLIGVPATLFCMPDLPLNTCPPIIPAGLPSEILLRRPDLAEAERMMASEHALIGVAYAGYFPSITLTGTLGFASPDIKQMFSWISRLWAMGANIAQVIFDAGRTQSFVNAAWARYNQASGNYQQKVIRAFQEVEDSLNNIEQHAKQAEKLDLSVQAATKTVNLSNSRYLNGLASYLEVTDSQRQELQSKRIWIHVQGARFIDTVQLIKALGGGWQCKNSENE